MFVVVVQNKPNLTEDQQRQAQATLEEGFAQSRASDSPRDHSSTIARNPYGYSANQELYGKSTEHSKTTVQTQCKNVIPQETNTKDLSITDRWDQYQIYKGQSITRRTTCQRRRSVERNHKLHLPQISWQWSRWQWQG